MFKILLKYIDFDIADISSDIMEKAAKERHIHFIKYLLQDPRFDPSANDNETFHNAIKSKDLDLVELLLLDPRVKPDSDVALIDSLSLTGNVIPMTKLLLDSQKINPYSSYHIIKTAHEINYKIMLPGFKKELLELIYSNNKIYPFVIEKYLHIDTVIKTLKPRIRDSLSGFAVGYFITKSDIGVDQTYLTTVSKKIINIFYRNFARYLIGVKKSILFRIEKLTEMIKRKIFDNLRPLVIYAANSILHNKKITKSHGLRASKIDFVGVIRGFLFLSYY